MFRYCSCHAVVSVHCSVGVTCWERADLLALLYVTFSCVFIAFPHGVLGQVWYLMYPFLIVAFFLTFNALTSAGPWGSRPSRSKWILKIMCTTLGAQKMLIIRKPCLIPIKHHPRSLVDVSTYIIARIRYSGIVILFCCYDRVIKGKELYSIII